MKRLLLNILIRMFLREQRDIKKISVGEELSKYRFKNSEDTIEILKHNRTCMTLWHFETSNQQEALIVKGMSLMLNILIDAHEKSVEINSITDVEKRLFFWTKYKKIESTNIWYNILKAVGIRGDK